WADWPDQLPEEGVFLCSVGKARALVFFPDLRDTRAIPVEYLREHSFAALRTPLSTEQLVRETLAENIDRDFAAAQEPVRETLAGIIAEWRGRDPENLIIADRILAALRTPAPSGGAISASDETIGYW